jgi:hypothetical protein
MSMDYPNYEEMKRRGSRGRWFWIIGDRLYYLGLLGAFIFPIVVPLGILREHKFDIAAIMRTTGAREWIHALGAVLAIFLFFAGVFFVGRMLKGLSYKIAEREGIDIH